MLALDRPQEVGHFLRGIGEGIGARVILDVNFLDTRGLMKHLDLTVEF